jgi:peptidyl-prolyl cis-trans isomerase A (cyclophilin A)
VVGGDRRDLSFGDVAQLVAHLLCKQGVVGSSPIVSTQYGSSTRLGAPDPPGVATNHCLARHVRMGTMNVTLHTNQGDIRVNLFPDHAPKTVANFVGLADGTREWKNSKTGKTETSRFYDGLTFHRIIPGFMIQGGCPDGNGRGGPGYTFDDEIHPELTFSKPYLLAMANAGKGTNGSQFFVTVDATTWLQGKHTIFGEVADQEGRDVVDAIVAVPTGPGDSPISPVVIERVTVG